MKSLELVGDSGIKFRGIKDRDKMHLKINWGAKVQKMKVEV